MNLTHLKYIVEVERQGSIPRAAQALYMGQPNLSKAIKEMEQEVGITIFRRSVKGVVPTEKGREFLQYAKAIIVQMDKMEQLYKDGSEERAELSVFVSGADCAVTAFARTVGKLGSAERCDLRLGEGSLSQAADAVIECGYPIAVVGTELSAESFLMTFGGNHGLKAQELFTCELVVLANEGSPLAAYEEAAPEVLAELTEVTGTEHRENTSHRRIYVRGRDGRTAVLRSAAGTFMYSVPLSAAELRREGLIQRRCTPPRKVHVLLLTRESTRLTPVEQAFTAEVAKAAKEI